LSDNVLDRIAKPDTAADGIDPGGLPYFCRYIMASSVFRPNLLCSVGISLGPSGNGHFDSPGWPAALVPANTDETILKPLLAREKTRMVFEIRKENVSGKKV
jgi:hypothetical protein